MPISKSFDQHLAEWLRTNEECAAYLEAALEQVEHYSPKDELEALCLVVSDVVKSLRQPRLPAPAPEIAALVAEIRDRVAASPNNTAQHALCVRTIEELCTALTAESAARVRAEDQNARMRLWMDCSICGGSPHSSGKVCICEGKNTVGAEIEGFQQYIFELERRIEQAHLALDGITGLNPAWDHETTDDYLTWCHGKAVKARAALDSVAPVTEKERG